MQGAFYSQISAQTGSYSSPFFVKTLFNPSFNGAVDCTEAALAYKRNNLHEFMTAELQHYFDKQSSSVSILFSGEKQGNGILRGFSAGISYAHRFKVGHNKIINAGIKADYVHQSVDYNKLIFSNQIDYLEETIAPLSEQQTFAPVHTQDISAGISYFSKKYRMGIAVVHLDKFRTTQPPIFLPRLNLNIGRILTPQRSKQKIRLIPEIIYSLTFPNFHQLTYACQLKYKKIYSAIFIKHSPNIPSLSSAFQLGISFVKFRLSYTYEILISRKIPLPFHSNQVNLEYKFNCEKKRKKRNTIFCAKY
ncbi:MAG: hypothetical protein CSB06_01495 [Bacteroidia bacterium]|nr:MAG: hypothetical protein CSB06_01495 [Bacteroidia bacterium]